MVDGNMYTDKSGDRPSVDVSPGVGRKGESGGSVRSRTGSILHKFGSLRITKKKPYSELIHCIVKLHFGLTMQTVSMDTMYLQYSYCTALHKSLY